MDPVRHSCTSMPSLASEFVSVSWLTSTGISGTGNHQEFRYVIVKGATAVPHELERARRLGRLVGFWNLDLRVPRGTTTLLGSEPHEDL